MGVGVAVGSSVSVGVGVSVAVGVGVAVALRLAVAVAVIDGVMVGVADIVGEGVRVAVSVPVGASIDSVATGVSVSIGASVRVTSGRRRLQALASNATNSRARPPRTRNCDSSALIFSWLRICADYSRRAPGKRDTINPLASACAGNAPCRGFGKMTVRSEDKSSLPRLSSEADCPVRF